MQKDFDAIPKTDLKRILHRIENLTENPRPPGCEKLTGQDRYRLHQGRYRIVYSVQDEELTVWVVAHRKHIAEMNLWLRQTPKPCRLSVLSGLDVTQRAQC
jgi:mRNA interferase RelE/StbE